MHHCCAVGKVVSCPSFLEPLRGPRPSSRPAHPCRSSLWPATLTHSLPHGLPHLDVFSRFQTHSCGGRGGGSESGEASKAMITASQPPKWTGREGRTPSPRACYVSSWGHRWRLLAAADCWSLRSDSDMQQHVSGSEGDVYLGRLHSLHLATCLEAAPGPRPAWAILRA